MRDSYNVCVSEMVLINTCISCYIDFPKCDVISSFFSDEICLLCCAYNHVFLMQPSADSYTVYFYIYIIVDSPAINTDVQIFLRYIFDHLSQFFYNLLERQVLIVCI